MTSLFTPHFTMGWPQYYTNQARSSPGRSFPFETHYKTQIGGGFYAGVKHQQGYGLGGIFSKIGRFVMPLLKPVAKSIGRQFLRSGTLLAEDILNGENPAAAFEKNLKRRPKELFQKASKPKNKKRRVSKKPVISKKKRPRKRDVFDS